MYVYIITYIYISTYIYICADRYIQSKVTSKLIVLNPQSFRRSCPPGKATKLAESLLKRHGSNGRWQHDHRSWEKCRWDFWNQREKLVHRKNGWHLGDNLLVRFTQGMDGLLGVAGMIITSDYGSFPHSLLSTSKITIGKKLYRATTMELVMQEHGRSLGYNM